MVRNDSAKPQVTGVITEPEVTQASEEFPGWYHRVSSIVAARAHKKKIELSQCWPNLKDFDEDISEYESEGSLEKDLVRNSTCGIPGSRRGPLLNNSGDPDDGYRYKIYKRIRDRRKQVLFELRKRRTLRIEMGKKWEEQMLEAMEKAMERVRKGKNMHRLDLEETRFNLYSSEYASLLPLDHFRDNMSLEFSEPFDPEDQCDAEGWRGAIVGRIHLDSGFTIKLEVFGAPQHVDPCGNVYGIRDDTEMVSLAFIDRHFVKLRIPYDTLRSQISPPKNAKYSGILFVGVNSGFEREMMRKRKREEETMESSRRQLRCL